MSGIVDPVFKQIPKGSTCFLIWRIEKLQVVPLPKDQYGSFYNGDAYIVYSATEPGQPGGLALKVNANARALEQHIHFWLGSSVSSDEAGTAAYKTVELDDFLGGAPIQHRETEGAESQRFRSYFPNGIRLLQGGMDSGFNHVTNTFNPRLYSIKGKRRPVLRQLPSVNWNGMNSGDAFILQMKEAIFIWEGQSANNLEKLQAAKIAQQLKAETGGRATIVFVEDGQEENLHDAEKTIFETQLPLKDKKSMRPATDDDDKIDRELTSEIKLYRCSDDDGTLRVTEVKTGPLFQNDLNSGDSFIVDNGANGVWVWIGKKASNKERIEAMRNAEGFKRKKNYPEHTSVTRVIDGGEPEEFRSLFSNWKVKNETVGFGRQNSAGKGIAATIHTVFDAATLHDQPKLAAKTGMIDDGSGAKEVFKIHNFKLVEVPVQNQGSFFEHDCYVVKYTAGGPREHILVYFWLGLKSTNEDQGAAALKAVELDDAVDGRAIQVRITQGKEPPHFIAMFGGEMIVYLGDADDSGYEPVKPYLLQVRGNVPQEARAIQVTLRGSSLNSNDVFVLAGESTTYLWCGKGSTGDEREIAKRIASKDRVDCITVYEGQEKAEFWEAIGGKEEYASDKRLAEEDNKDSPPRLFQCSNATGNLKAEEIINFAQIDLVEDDVMLLDVGHTVFLWYGKDSNKTEQELTIALAQKYLKTDPSGRDSDTPILRIKQGMEPPTFTGFFGVWDRALWSDNKSYEEMKKEMQAEQPILTVASIASLNNGVDFASCSKYAVEVLQEKDPEKLPQDVNPQHKELHLSEADFESVFKNDYTTFSALPQWKKTQLKKSVGLF